MILKLTKIILHSVLAIVIVKISFFSHRKWDMLIFGESLMKEWLTNGEVLLHFRVIHQEIHVQLRITPRTETDQVWFSILRLKRVFIVVFENIRGSNEADLRTEIWDQVKISFNTWQIAVLNLVAHWNVE